LRIYPDFDSKAVLSFNDQIASNLFANVRALLRNPSQGWVLAIA
jgi:hypothetical protein